MPAPSRVLRKRINVADFATDPGSRSVSCGVSLPFSVWLHAGKGGLALPEGLREEEIRRFRIKENIEGLDDDHAGDGFGLRGEPFQAKRVAPWAGGFVDVLG